MKEDPLSPLRDALLRRDLTAAEERRVTDWLLLHPEAAGDWEADRSLGRALRGLAPAPVPSNFTSRVMAEIRRHQGRAPASGKTGILWRRLIPATGALALLTAVFAGWQLHEADQRQQEACVAGLRALAAIPPEILADFEVIQRLGANPSPVDYDLLAALE
jgi:anti-sigma factor RsiW